jgi:hypothetical protein
MLMPPNADSFQYGTRGFRDIERWASLAAATAAIAFGISRRNAKGLCAAAAQTRSSTRRPVRGIRPPIAAAPFARYSASFHT